MHTCSSLGVASLSKLRVRGWPCPDYTCSCFLMCFPLLKVNEFDEVERLDCFDDYSYRVKILTQGRKNDSMVREMRRFHGRFTSVMDVKVKILEEFEDMVPPNISFAIGYFNGKQSTKYWLCTREDLAAMYDSHTNEPGKCIRLWCDGKSRVDHVDKQASKRKKVSEESKTRREVKEDKVADLAKELREKNCDVHDLSEPQYSLWARMIISGSHSSMDSPPQIPMITGISGKRNTRKSLDDDAVVRAAAIFNNVSSTQIVSASPVSASSPISVGVSPGKAVDIRGKSLNQLSTIKKLCEDGVLSQREYEEQKEIILGGLKKL